MTSPSFDTRISLGNVLTITTIILAAGVAWGAAQAEIRSLRSKVLEVEAAASSREVRLRAVEAGAARDGARMDAILQSLARIEARLDRTEGR